MRAVSSILETTSSVHTNQHCLLPLPLCLPRPVLVLTNMYTAHLYCSDLAHLAMLPSCAGNEVQDTAEYTQENRQVRGGLGDGGQLQIG